MSKKRKNDHIKLALRLKESPSDFDHIRFTHHSIPRLNLDEVKLDCEILGQTFPLPFYINAMTGGTKKGNRINFKLAALAAYFNIPFFIGSQSLAFKDPLIIEEYKALRRTFPSLFIVGNINPNFTLDMAREAINMLGANALAIHVNSIQELTMKEGDRDFSKWEANIENIIKHVSVPVIVKEVGYGMGKETLDTLVKLDAHYVDISGTGGTNFTEIELKRNKQTYNPFKDFGISTVTSLKLAKDYSSLTVYASGGIDSAAKIVKAMALGAKACGMARYFLKLSTLSEKEMIREVDELIINIKKILVLLNVKTIQELDSSKLIILG